MSSLGPQTKFPGSAKAGLQASRQGKMRIWEGEFQRKEGEPRSPLVVTGKRFQDVVRRIQSFSAGSGLQLGVRAEVTGQPGLDWVPDNKEGIWEVKGNFQKVYQLDKDGVPDPPEEDDDTPEFCLCGCGAEVNNKFLPGHDMKLKSRLIKAAKRGEDLDPPHVDGKTDPWAVASSLGWSNKLPSREKN